MARNICMDCGKKLGTKNKGTFGIWIAKCDFCGETRACADAVHDFGVYENEKEKEIDKIQDQI